jgi:hypothetical protein
MHSSRIRHKSSKLRPLIFSEFFATHSCMKRRCNAVLYSPIRSGATVSSRRNLLMAPAARLPA